MRVEPPRPDFSLSSFLAGIVGSALVMWLLLNLQNISDLSPASIKESSAPGALGLPVVIVSAGWIIFVCVAFTRPIMRGSLRGTGPQMPGPFVLGAFVSLAASIGAIRYFDIGLL